MSEEVEESKTVRFPALAKPCLFLDPASGDFWIGLPLKRLQFIEVSVILDEMKAHAFRWYKQTASASRIIQPINDAIQRTKAFLSRGRA